MKQRLSILFVFLPVILGLWGFNWGLSGCATSSNSSSPTTTACQTSYCSGIYYNPYASNQVTSQTKQGFFARTTNFSNYSSFSTTNTGGVLNMQSGFSYVLREAMGVCERETYSGGTASCSSWVQGLTDIFLIINGNTATTNPVLWIRTYPQTNAYYNYYYSLPSLEQFFFSFTTGIYLGNPQGVYDPLQLGTTLFPVNNSQGFEVRAYGPSQSQAYNKLFQLQVAQGKLADSSFTFSLYYNAYPVATGTMVAY